jgi:hypothetical protein
MTALPDVKSCASYEPDTEASDAATFALDPEVERRCAKALALLADNPNWRRAIVVEAGDPVIVSVAIRGIGYGEIEIAPDRYDPLAIIELLDRYAVEAGGTIH